MARPKIYLAGPDIFLPNAGEISWKKKTLTEAAGFTPLDPLDNNPVTGELATMGGRANFAMRIFQSDIEMVYECDAVIANLTPYSGISADVGTAVEIGLALGLGKKVFGYTNDRRDFHRRTIDANPFCTLSENGEYHDEDGKLIENFGGMDNLMIDRLIPYSSGYPVYRDHVANGAIGAIEGFKVCLGYARYVLLQDANDADPAFPR